MDVKSIPCPTCQEEATRRAFYQDYCLVTETGAGSGYGRTTRNSEAYDKNGRVAVSRFQEACQERDYNHKKAEESAQKPLKSRDLYHESLKRAERMGAKKNGRDMATTK